MEPIVGIDLGTTNSEVAFIINERAEIIKDNDTGIMPSCVALNDDGKIIVGHEARNQAVIKPAHTVMSVKRLMGTDRKLILGDKEFSPQEISAFILKALQGRAEKMLNRPIRKAVITVPAYFTDIQRQATREAGEIAGLEVVRIINEPTAAALAYENYQPDARKIMVFDLGGGTFDVSIVNIEGGVVEVLASTGDNHLGGDDFDHKILEHLLAYMESELELSVGDNLTVLARLRRAAENAKIALSDAPLVMIEEDHIGKNKGKDVHLTYELSREEFESLIHDDLMRTMESVTRAMEDASVLPGDIEKIILVGGSTRIPKISHLLEEKIGHSPHGEIDPDLCVALGAAIQAGREMGLQHTSILIDITPYTFGTSAVGMLDGIMTPHRFVPLIRRNTKLPAKKSDLFYTMYDNQEWVEIDVCQGENPDALQNVQIGRYIFDMTPAPAGAEILLDYELDVNGILKIEAVEKSSGRKINAVIENALTQFSSEELEQRRNTVNQMWQDNDAEASAASSALPYETRELLQRARESLNRAPAEDRDELIAIIEDIEDAGREGRLAEVADLHKELADILFYLD